MRLLVIDDSPEYRQVLRYHVEVQWPDAIVDDYQPSSARTVPDAAMLGSYDLILLGHPLEGEQGFEWLARLRAVSGRPPIIVFAEPSDEFLAVDALKAGASSYFPKARVTHQRLVETIRCELGNQRNEAAVHVGPESLLRTRNYEFLETLHSSELAAVYLARAGEDLMAFKVIRYVPDSGGDRLFDRFLQEYEVVAKIHHANVVRIFDLGIADDHAYIAMEYLSAGSLAERLNGALQPERALEYLRQIASALEAIHGAGVLHRDLKPGNIMFRGDDSLALIDFGLAKQMELRAAMTGAGQIFGTPYYMSPEQGHAEPTDARSDIYSLGCIFYEMLTGERPFTAGTPMGVLYKHANARRPRLEHGLEIFQSQLDRMLAVRPADRYQSAAELLEAFEAI